MSAIEELIEFMRGLEADHLPEGWPAVRMQQITALCDAVQVHKDEADLCRRKLGMVEAEAFARGREIALEERDRLAARVAELERYHVQAIAHRICGEIPERFHIEMVLENGAGWVSLFHDGKPVEIDMADWNIAEQFDVAMQCVVEYTNQIEGGQ